MCPQPEDEPAPTKAPQPRKIRRFPSDQAAPAAGDLAADVEHDAELSWDSAVRRELHVEGIKAGPDQAAASTAWKRADVDQARHPREAVQGGH